MKNTLLPFLLSAFLSLSHSFLFAQCINGFEATGRPCGGTIQTAVPFLRITPDARSAAMGDVGIALTPDANAILYNASKLALADKKWGAAINYSPWLTNVHPDIFLLHQAGYYQFGEKTKQAVSAGFQYFSLGEIQLTDFNAQPIGTGHPYEIAFTGAYSRQLSDNWALGLSAKYIHSDLATGLSIPDSSGGIRTGKAAALDISTFYKKTIIVSGHETNLLLGATDSNIGNKIT